MQNSRFSSWGIEWHAGLVLMIYGFVGLFGFVPEFLHYLEAHPIFAFFKLSIWLLLITMGFILAYPLLKDKLFSYNHAMMRQGEQVMEGFDPARLPIGLIGILVSILIVISQLRFV